MVDLGEHFRRSSRKLHSEWLRQQRWFAKTNDERQRQEKIADGVEELDNDLLSVATETVMAANDQITAFETKLDEYDEATITALMENQEVLDRVRTRLNELLDRAYVMDDGRRVFKTEDGTQVFDEFGREIARDELDFDAITSNRPSWEEYKPDYEKRLELEVERQKILDFQRKTGEAREKIADGEISEAELNDLDEELDEALPPSVRAHLPRAGGDENVLKTDFASPSGTEITPGMPSAARAVPAPKLNPME